MIQSNVCFFKPNWERKPIEEMKEAEENGGNFFVRTSEPDESISTIPKVIFDCVQSLNRK